MGTFFRVNQFVSIEMNIKMKKYEVIYSKVSGSKDFKDRYFHFKVVYLFFCSK